MAIIRWIIGRIILFLDHVFAPASVERTEEERRRILAVLNGMELYQFEACPFCVKVRRFLKSEGISLPLRDAKAEPYRSELIRGGGKAQVPCLKVSKADGSVEWMYESGDIIAFLRGRLTA